MRIAEINVDNKDLIDTTIIVTKAIQWLIICDSRRGDSDTDMETGCLTFAVIIHSLIFQITRQAHRLVFNEHGIRLLAMDKAWIEWRDKKDLVEQSS